MREVWASEAKTHLNAGERRTPADRQQAQEAGEALRALRAKFGGATIEEILEMRDEGRS